MQPWRDSPLKNNSEVIDRESKETLGTIRIGSTLGKLTGEKVFDTWMDSSNSNLYVSGYLRSEIV